MDQSQNRGRFAVEIIKAIRDATGPNFPIVLRYSQWKQQDSSTRSVDDLLERLDAGEFDLVAVGRALLQDPNWANKIKENRTNELEQYSGKALATLS